MRKLLENRLLADDSLVIETPLLLPSSPNKLDVFGPIHNDEDVLEEDVLEADVLEAVNNDEDYGTGNSVYETNANKALDDRYDDISIAQYNFQALPLRQLSSSITSVTTIDVLISLFSDLFEMDLIPQAMNDFDAGTNPLSKMLSKLDLRIFQHVLDDMKNDLKDIMDINVSNNELCYQLKQIVAVREEMNEQLVAVRKESQELKCGGEWYQVQEEQLKLKKRVELNNQLNELSDKLKSSKEIGELTEENSMNNNIAQLSTFLDPYNGTLAKIDRINIRLQKELVSNKG